jgi:fibronectin-binding autotransporter adhesin
VLGGSPARAAIYTWDSIGLTTGPQDGSGTWSTSTASWWNGTTNVNWNNAVVNDAWIGSGGALILGTITVSGTVNLGNITFAPVLTGSYLVTSGTINLAAASGTSVITNTAASQIDSTLAGSARLVKAGSQMLTLGGANTYTGGTEITGGMLRITSTNALGSASSPVILTSGTLDLNFALGNTVEIGALSGSAGTVITRSGLGAVTLRAGVGNGSSTYLGSIQDGPLGGSISFSKRGTGLLVLGGASTYSGTTFISDGGILRAENNAALGSTAGGTTINAGTLQLAGGITIAGEALTVNAGGDATLGSFQNLSGNNTWTGSIALGTSTKFTSSSGTLAISGNIAGASSSLTLGGAGAIAITGTTALGTGGITKVDTGTVTLGSLSYSGATTLGTYGGSTAGLLHLQGTGSNTTGAMTIYSGTLRLGGSQTLTGTLSLGGGAAGTVARLDTGTATLRLGADVVYNAGNNPGGAVIDGVVDMNATLRTFTVYDSAAATDLTINGRISGTNLLKSGDGTMVLGGSNSYTGYTSVGGGTLIIGGDSSLGATPVVFSASSIMISPGATLAASSSVTLNANRGIYVASGTAGLSAGAGNTLSYGGSISGGGSLVKVDTGTLVLSGSSGYTGATTVRQGALVLNGGSLNHSSSALTVGNLSGDNAQLGILAGGKANSSSGNIGDQAGSIGSAVVSGTGSAWNNSGNLYVGNLGRGTITVENGATVTSAIGYIGNNAASSGTATVTGQGSAWTNSDRLIVGNSGTGSLSVTAGGAVSDVNGLIGSLAGSTGTAVVSGTSASGTRSSWTSSANLFVGNFGTGSLRVENGGLVQNATGYVGTDVGSLGSVVVTGPSSSWTNSAGLFIGSSGTGSLSIVAGGTVSVAAGSGTATLSAGASGRGTLNIGAAAGETAAAAGVLNAAVVNGGSGAGALVQFNHIATSSLPYSFTTTGSSNGTGIAIRGSASVVQTAGYTTLTAASTFTGSTTVNGGTLALAAENALQSTAGIRITGGTLLLSGSTGNHINNSATLDLAGGTFDTNGRSEVLGSMLLSGDAAIDLNDPVLGGASVLHFADSSAQAWAPSAILAISGWSGSISGGGTDQIRFGSSASALTTAQIAQITFIDPLGFAPGTYAAKILASGEIVAVPEPTTGALLLMAAGAFALRGRKRARR